MLLDDGEKLGSCKTYSTIARQVSDKYGVPMSTFETGRRIDQLMRMIDRIVKNECTRAAEEAVYRIRCHDAAILSDTSEVSAYIPETSIRVNAGGVGLVKIRKFSSERAFAAA